MSETGMRVAWIADATVGWVDDDGLYREAHFRNGEEIAYPWEIVTLEGAPE